MNNPIIKILIAVMVSMTVIPQVQAESYQLNSTPVKQVSLTGEYAQIKLGPRNIIDGKGLCLDSPKRKLQFCVAEMSWKLTEKSQSLLQNNDVGQLTAEQLAAFKSPKNPEPLRLCIAGGKPYFATIKGKRFLISEFQNSEVIPIATASGAKVRFDAVDCHAFASSNGSILHIWMVKSLSPADATHNCLPPVSKEFHQALESIEWR